MNQSQILLPLLFHIYQIEDIPIICSYCKTYNSKMGIHSVTFACYPHHKAENK